MVDAYQVPVVTDTTHGTYSQPAVFRVGGDGTVMSAYVTPDAFERVTPDDLLEDLRRVSGTGPAGAGP